MTCGIKANMLEAMKTFALLMTALGSIGCGGGGGSDGDADTDSDSDSDTDTGTEVCDADAEPADDEIVPALVAPIPAAALAMATDWTTAVVCGADFAMAIDLASGDAGPSAAIPAPCTGVSVEGSRVAVVDAQGTLLVFDLGAGSALTEVDRDDNLAGIYEDVLLSGGTAYVAARSSGILRFDASGATLSVDTAWTGATDARAIARDGDGFAVADGTDGARLLDATGAVTDTLALTDITSPVEGPSGPEDVTLPWEGESISVSDAWIVVGSGAYGYSWREKGGGEVFTNGRPYFAEGPVFAVALEGPDRFLYAEGGSIRRMQIANDGALSRSASEYRAAPKSIDGGWWVGVAARDGEALLLATDALFRVDLGAHVPAPDVDLERLSLFAMAEVGATYPAPLTLRNYGDRGLSMVVDSIEPATLQASFLDLAGLDEPDENGCLLLPAGGSGGAVQVDFTPVDTAPVEGTLVLASNDVDEASLEIPVHANRAELDVGDVAPDFVLTSLDGRTYRLSEHAGEVVLLMFYNST